MNPRRKITKAVARKRPATLATLGKQLAIYAETSEQLIKSNGSSEAIEAAYKQAARVVDEILRRPAPTFAGLQVKARALAWCYSGEPGGQIHLIEGTTTDAALARSHAQGGDAVSAVYQQGRSGDHHAGLCALAHGDHAAIGSGSASASPRR